MDSIIRTVSQNEYILSFSFIEGIIKEKLSLEISAIEWDFEKQCLKIKTSTKENVEVINNDDF